MLFMTIGEFPPESRKAVVARRAEVNFQMVPGVKQLHHWSDVAGGRTFTVAEAEDASAIAAQLYKWSDIMRFQVIPIVSREQMSKVISG